MSHGHRFAKSSSIRYVWIAFSRASTGRTCKEARRAKDSRSTLACCRTRSVSPASKVIRRCSHNSGVLCESLFSGCLDLQTPFMISRVIRTRMPSALRNRHRRGTYHNAGTRIINNPNCATAGGRMSRFRAQHQSDPRFPSSIRCRMMASQPPKPARKSSIAVLLSRLNLCNLPRHFGNHESTTTRKRTNSGVFRAIVLS